MEQHREEVDMIRDLDNDFVKDLAEFFKIFGDATRIRILRLLMDQEQNVGELADALDMTQSAVSHQLRVLRQNGLVRYRKEGKTVYYSLDDDHAVSYTHLEKRSDTGKEKQREKDACRTQMKCPKNQVTKL